MAPAFNFWHGSYYNSFFDFWSGFRDTSLIPRLNPSISLLSTSAVSRALWQATLRASSYNSLLLSLGSHSSLDPWASPVVQLGTPTNANDLLGRIGYHGLLSLSSGPHKVEDLRTFSTNKHCGKCPSISL